MNGFPPDRVIVYRDGGNVGTLDYLRKHECKQILEAVNSKLPDLKHFSFLIAAKRIHERIMWADGVIKQKKQSLI